MPFFLFRKRAASALSNDGCSSTAISNDSAVGISIKKNTSSCKRKKLSTKSTQALDSKANREYGDVSNNRRHLDQFDTLYILEGDCISSILLQLYEKRLVLNLGSHVGIDNKYQHLLQLLKEQEECVDGCGQDLDGEVYLAASRALEEYYEGLGDSGLATLQKDIATCFNRVSIDSDTDEDESLAAAEGDINYTTQNVEDDIRFNSGGDVGGLGELRTGIPVDGTPLKFDRAPNGVESGNQSSVAADVVGDGDIAQDDGDFSFDIGSNNNDGLVTTPIDTSHTNTSHTNTSPTTDEDNAPPTTSNLKLDSIKCVERVDNKRDDPSPTNVTANLSSFTNDTSPPSNNDSHDEDECYETLSPKKVNSTDYVGNNNTPTTAMSTPQTIQASPSSAFAANLGKLSQPSNHGISLPQFQQQHHQLSYPQRQYYDRATLESMSDEELRLRYYQHQQWQEQQRQQRQFAQAQQQLLQQQQYHLITSDPLFHAMLAKGIHPTIAYNTFLGQQTQYYPPNHLLNTSTQAVPGQHPHHSLPPTRLTSQSCVIHQPTEHHPLYRKEADKQKPKPKKKRRQLSQEESKEEDERKRQEKLKEEARKKLDEERKKQAVSWLLECMHFTSEVNSITRTGTWGNEEKIRLLFGIYLFGYGKWKSIQPVVSTRSYNQVRDKANQWIPKNMSNIEATGSILSSLEEVQTFYNQTLPKVESVMNQLENKEMECHLITRTSLLFKTKELNKEQWQELQARGIKEVQRLIPNEPTTSNVSFELGSVHSISSNLDTHKIVNLDYAKSIFQDYMIRELEGRLESGTTVSVTNIIRRTEKKRVWAEVVYQVVKIEDSKLPAPVVSTTTLDGTAEGIKVPGYTFPSSVNARYHVSLGDLLKMYGAASLKHLYNLNEVAPLYTAKRVDQMSTDNPIRKHGGVYSFEFDSKVSPPSLPLSPILEEEEEEECIGDEDEQSDDEGFSNDKEVDSGKKKEEKDKHGMTGSFGGRLDKYIFKGKDGKMYIRIDGEDLSIEADAGLCKLYELLMNDVKNDPLVPPWIKRALCIMLHERGGDRFGAKKNIVYLLLEMALQLEDGQSVPGEMFQWDDTVFIGMVTKVMEALEAIKPLFARFPELERIITAAMMSWPPCEDEDTPNRVYNKPTATEYTGVDSMRDAFDGPAIQNAKTNEERYSTAYTMKKFNSAIEEITDFVLEALKCILTGCVFLLDKNDLACDKTRNNLHDILTSRGFEKVASVYEHPNDIIIYMKGNAMIVVHGPLCVGGTIMVEHFSLDDMLLRCLVIDTLRGIVCVAKGEEFNGPYLAIEAGMMQKLLVKGLHLTREYGVPAAFFREYLNTSKHVKCFDLYGGGRWVHYLEYPISNVNRLRYKKYNK